MSDAARAGVHDVLDRHGFASQVRMGWGKWCEAIPDTPGVYAVFDHDRLVYVGMAGRNGAGSLRKRLRDHASGQVVNMFAQYLLFARVLDAPERPRTPREAAVQCRKYIAAHCSVPVLSLTDVGEVRRTEVDLRKRLSPEFNAIGLLRPEQDFTKECA